MRRVYFILAFCFLLSGTVSSQNKTDTTKQSFTKRAFNEGLSLIKTNSNDTITNVKSADPYKLYAGKIIRSISVEQVGFEVSIYEDQKRSLQKIGKLANNLHSDTREKIIRNHLFIRINDSVEPEKLGDNERYIRDRDFIQDCRIVVTPTESPDSVDVTVITRDVFSIGGRAGGSFPNAPEIGVYDANVGGRGQRTQLDLLFNNDRDPKVGFGLLYRKSSVLGSMTDFEAGYSQLNTGRSYGNEKEYSAYIKLERPLVSPYTRLAGGLELSRNWSKNLSQKEDSLFNDYSYNISDVWVGYNMGLRRGFKNLNRNFLAIRFFDGFYTDPPDIETFANRERYDNFAAYLVEYTFYRQQYYKTRYVLRFGVTEDLPYGFAASVSAGYNRVLRVERPYGALKFRYSRPNKKGNFYQFNLETSSYYRNSKAEDIVLFGRALYYTRALPIGNKKLRNLVDFSYTYLGNTVTNSPLVLNRDFIAGLSTDSLFADQRLTLGAESTLYTNWAILGFRMGPFAGVDYAIVNCISCPESIDSYMSISAGVRTRNENLIFGTLELKFSYIPRNEFGESEFNFRFRQRFRLRDRSFIQAPRLIQYNSVPN